MCKGVKYNISILILLFELVYSHKLYTLKKFKNINLMIYQHCIFMIVNILDYLNIFSIYEIEFLYILCNLISKFITIIVINIVEEQKEYMKNNVDLQSISLLSKIKKTINNFNDNNIISKNCETICEHINLTLNELIPIDKTFVKIELLKKILPFELEENYICDVNDYKKYNYICVLFTDIVSYTELAKKYDETIIYKLLNEIYTRFDLIVSKYKNIQKIETIGDAYMVVGNLYKKDDNDKNEVIDNIIKLGIDFINEIKKISTPDNVPLQLRIGIHIGNVIVGILGKEVPRLCVIGNTVNIASRLQSTAEPNTIQLSRHIFELIDEIEPKYNFVIKENVFLKNIGSVTTYNLNM